jgi:glycosyltransferase involved in cell wall biosynthesis
MTGGHDPPRRPRVLIVCPKYYPSPDGLGNYTTEFCRHLARRLDVAVWTSKHRGNVEKASGPPPGNVEVIDTVERWTWGRPLFHLRDALRFRPDRILVEFVPFMYSPRGGINFGLVLLAAILAVRARLRGAGRVQVMFHELWFPFTWKPKDFVLHVAHRCMVFGLAALSDDVFCSTTRFARQVRGVLGPLSRPVHVLPVGSSLERNESPSPPPRVRDKTLRIALFGSLHVSKNVPLVVRALHEAARSSPWTLRLTIIGPTLDELCAAMPDLQTWLVGEVRAEGPLEAERAADCLAQQDLFVAYFQDGVSTRRTTLMAALCEGVAVVTTWRDVSDDVFLDKRFLKLLSCDEDVFHRELVDFLATSDRPFDGIEAEEIRAFYRKHFSWSSIIERYVELSGLAAAARDERPRSAANDPLEQR